MADLPYVTPRRAAEILGVSRQRVHQLIAALLRDDRALTIDHPDLGRLITREGLARLRRRNTSGGRPRHHPRSA